MDRPDRSLVLSAALALALLGLLLPLSTLSQANLAARDGLIVTTGGSKWMSRDNRHRFDCFQPLANRLEVVTRVPMEHTLQQHVDFPMAPGAQEWYEQALTSPLPEALIVDLEGETTGFSGANVDLSLWDAQDDLLVDKQRLSGRGLHLDQPLAQTYRVLVKANAASTCTLTIGTGQSPFLTQPLDSYSFLLVPDSGPLSDRERARIQQFVQSGGNLVVLAEQMQDPRYRSASNFDALNEILSGCGMQFTGQLLTTALTTTANTATVNILTDVRPHRVTDGVHQLVATGSTLSLSGSAQGLVFDDQGDPVIAVSRMGRGQCLAIGTGIGFNSDFRLRENDPLAANIIEWASVRGVYVVYLPVVLRGSLG